MKKLKYHFATTLDGFIEEGEHVTDYFDSLKNDHDAILMGRKTYEFGFQFGVTDPYPWMMQAERMFTWVAARDWPRLSLVRDWSKR